jgi:hypothetical protein
MAQFLPARIAHDYSPAEKLPERRRAHSTDQAGLGVEEHRAGCVLAARGLVIKYLDAAELRVVVPQYSPSSPPMPFLSHTTS